MAAIRSRLAWLLGSMEGDGCERLAEGAVESDKSGLVAQIEGQSCGIVFRVSMSMCSRCIPIAKAPKPKLVLNLQLRNPRPYDK